MKTLFTCLCICMYAVTSLAQNSGDYRSIKNGYWNDKTVWQRYSGTAWVAATVYPTNADGKITISDTTNVTINLSFTTDQTVVEAGGVLTLLSNYTVTLGSGAGDDLTVNGELDMSSGTFVSPGNIKMNGVFHWSGGSIQAAFTNTGVISITGSVDLYSVLTNSGTINWLSTYLTFEGGTLNNNGVVNALIQGYLYNGNGGTFNNNANGVFNQNGNDETISRITFNNRGVMNFNGGNFDVNQGIFTNTNTLNFNGGSFQNESTTSFNKGTIITGSGSINQSYNTLNINLALTLPSSIEFILNNGTVTGSGSLKLNGIMTWNKGSVNIALTILNSSVVNIGYDEATLYSTLTNNGTINWLSTYLTFQGGTIINNKNFNAYGNGYFYNSNGGTFTNNAAGIFNRSVGIGNISNRINFTNAGTVNIKSGELLNESSGTFTNTGTLNINNATFENTATTNLNSGTSITGKGKIINSYNSMNINTSVILPASIDFYLTYSSGATLAGTGSLKINGKMYWQQGDINVPVTIQSTGVLNISQTSALYATLTNNGTINWFSNDIYFYGGSIQNNGVFNVLCDYRLYKSTSGSVVNNAGAIISKNSFGKTTATITVTNKGTISGTGEFDFGANLTNTGIFAPGVDTATGILTTGADYKNKTLLIKMKGNEPGLSFDRLLVNGNVTFGNDTLTVDTTGIIPNGSYTIVKFTGTRTGTIKVKNLPSNFSVTYTANKVVLKVADAFANKTNQSETEDVAQAKALNNKFSVYPNPANKTINIIYQSKNKTATMQVFDVNGKPVLQKIVSSNISNSVDVSKLAAGSYSIQISDSETKQTAKFIKQ